MLHDEPQREGELDEGEEHETPIEYDEGPLGVTLNVAIGCIRAAVYVPTLAHICTAAPMTFSLLGTRQHHHTAALTCRLIIELSVALLVLYDCVSASASATMGFGTFRERMKISVVASYFGFEGSFGVFLFRMMLWSVLILSSSFGERYSFASPFRHLPTEYESALKKHDTSSRLVEFFSSYDVLWKVAVVYAVIEVAALALSKLKSHMLSHPWTSPAIVDPDGRVTPIRDNSRWSTRAVVIVVCNATYMAYVISVFVTHMHKPHGHRDEWKKGLKAYENSVLLGFMLMVSIFEMAYYVLRNRNARSVSTVFLFNLLFFAYASCVVVAHGQAIRQAHMLVYWTLVMFVVNAAHLMLAYPCETSFRVVSHTCYPMCCTWRGVSGVCAMLACTMPVIGAMLATRSYGQPWFHMHPIFGETALAFIDTCASLKEAIGPVLSIIRVVGDVIGAALGAALCIAVVVAIVVALVMYLIPFSFGAAGFFPKKILEIARSVGKIFSNLKNFKKPLHSVKKFSQKGIELAKKMSSIRSTTVRHPASLFIVMLRVAFICVPAAFGLVTLAFVLWERKSLVSREAHVVFGAGSLVLCVASFAILAGFHWMLTLEIPLGFMKVGFKADWGLFWLEIGHAVALVGIVGYIVAALVGRSHHNEGDDVSPLETEVGREALKDVAEAMVQKGHKFTSIAPRVERHLLADGEHVIAEKYAKRSQCGDLVYGCASRVCCRCCPSRVTNTKWCCYHEQDEDAPRESVCSLALKAHCRCMSTCCCCCCSCSGNGDDADEDGDFVDERPLCPPQYCEWVDEDAITEDPSPFDETYHKGCCYRIGALGSYLIPILFALTALVFCVWSLSEEWLKFSTRPGRVLEDIHQDSTGQATQAAAHDEQAKSKSMCPITDMAVMIDAALAKYGGLFGFLAAPLYWIRTLMETFKELCSVISQLKDIVKFVGGLVMKLVFLGPAIIGACLVIGMSVVADFNPKITRGHMLIAASTVLLPGLGFLFQMPMLLEGVVTKIPFLKFTLVYLDGYKHAMAAYLLCVVALIALLADWVAPPLVPIKRADFDEDVALAEEEIKDPVYLNAILDSFEPDDKKTENIAGDDLSDRYKHHGVFFG